MEPLLATGEAASATHTLQIVRVDVIESAGEKTIVRADPKELSDGDLVVVSPLALPVVSPGAEKAPPMLLRLKQDGSR